MSSAIDVRREPPRLSGHRPVICAKIPIRGRQQDDLLLAAFNFTPVPRHDYRVGVPRGGYWQEVLNSDAQVYGGSGQGNCGGVEAGPVKWHHQPYSLGLTLPPLSASFFLSQGGVASP
jgi:1,4-alpha-glucan branching enzyme